MKQALGIIETVGLVSLIEAVDAMSKGANVSLVKWEPAGSGLVTAFIEGDVAAVRSAVDAGAEAASKVGKVMSAQVIPHPHEGLNAFVSTVKK